VLASIVTHDCLREAGCLSLTYDFGFPRTVCSFFLGCLTYRASRSLRAPSGILQIAGATTLALLFGFVDAYPVLAFAFPAAFALLILSLSRDDGWLARILTRKPFAVLGERSYSIYLMHMPLILIFENLAKRANGVAASSLVLLTFAAVLIIVSGWTYRFIEDPFRSMFNRFASAPRALRTDPAN
jgi:peptidoglycan/LPS O-acetylase OafA/YrhL